MRAAIAAKETPAAIDQPFLRQIATGTFRRPTRVGNSRIGLGIEPALGEPWRAVWGELARLIDDRPSNENNRWDVAAALNGRLSGGAGPFWGEPSTQARPTLTITKKPFPSGRLQQSRRVEQRLRRSGRHAHSVWKLFTAGSVGSQTLLGIPVLERLRIAPAFADFNGVWPFETGSAKTPSPERGPFILHAEIWPGAFPVDRRLHNILDAAQVAGLAKRFAGNDADGVFGQRFKVDEDDTTLRAEGWILGA